MIILFVEFLLIAALGLVIVQNSPLRKNYLDALTNSLFWGILSWKLSLGVTMFPVVKENPIVLLYSMGGLLNWIAGLFVFSLFMAISALRGKIHWRGIIVPVLGVWMLFLSPWHISGDLWFNPEQTSFKGQTITTLDGESVILGDGKVVILNFWASWCPPCMAEIPELNNFSTEYPDVLIGINTTKTERAADKAIAWSIENLLYTNAFDQENYWNNLFDVKSLPTTIILDGDGNFLVKYTGAVSKDWLVNHLNRIE